MNPKMKLVKISCDARRVQGLDTLLHMRDMMLFATWIYSGIKLIEQIVDLVRTVDKILEGNATVDSSI